ncbi:MAG: hypothetical protein RLZZ422_1300 [Pseudomonadota bacterium]|jgi:AraC-like DNA-binding protein
MQPLARGAQRQLVSVELNTIRAARDWMTTLCGPHQLEVKQHNHLLFRHGGAVLTQMSVGMMEYSTQVHVKTEDLLYSYSISLPVQGTQCLEQRKKTVNSHPQQGVIMCPGHAARLSMSEDCRKYLVRVSRFAVEEKVSCLLRRPISQPVMFEPDMTVDDKVGAWWQLVGHVYSVLNQPSSLFDLPEVWQSFQESIITGLLYAQPNNYSHELEHIRLNRPAYLLDLEHFMRDHVGQDLSLDDLERTSGMNRERLYKDFRQVYNSTPMSYFRDLRFQEVRQRLLAATHNTSVSSIALDCGFSQLGRFAHEYQDRFGELPSETLRKRQH